jgi:hypothetical protein
LGIPNPFASYCWEWELPIRSVPVLKNEILSNLALFSFISISIQIPIQIFEKGVEREKKKEASHEKKSSNLPWIFLELILTKKST